jgi:flagellar assembly factor FliW
MIVLESDEFGPLDVDEARVYQFALGLPGFEDRTRFALLQIPKLAPLQVLHSVDSPPLRFYTLDSFRLIEDYSLHLTPEQSETLGLREGDKPSHCLLLLTWPENAPPTVNLMAPVVLHEPTHRGLQAIQFDSGYDCRYPLSAPPEAICS